MTEEEFEKVLSHLLTPEITRVSNEIIDTSSVFSVIFLTYRALSAISIFCYVSVVYMYYTKWCFPFLLAGVVFSLCSWFALRVSENTINGLIELNTSKDTLTYQLVLKLFSNHVNKESKNEQ